MLTWRLLKHWAYLNTARDCALHVIPPLISLQPLQHLIRFSTIEIDSHISSINFQKTTRRTASRTWRCSVPRSSSCLAFFDTASTSLTKKRWSPLCSEARPHLHVQRDLLLLILVHLPLLALITGIIFSPKENWLIRNYLPLHWRIEINSRALILSMKQVLRRLTLLLLFLRRVQWVPGASQRLLAL